MKQNVIEEIGILTLAFGRERYHKQAENLARSIRFHHPNLRLAIVTDDAQRHSELFDITVPLDPTKGFGVDQKINLFNYSPFEETLFVDSDCILTSPLPEAHIEALRSHSFAPVGDRYLFAGDSDPGLENLEKTLSLLNIDYFAKFNGGVYFFKKDAHATDFFECASAILAQRTSLGILNFDKSGPGDETIFGLAMAVKGMKLYDDKGEIMRSPIGIVGRLRTHPFRGTRFNKEGILVRPALVHYVGERAKSAIYDTSALILRLPWLASLHDLVYLNIKFVHLSLKVARKLRLLSSVS